MSGTAKTTIVRIMGEDYPIKSDANAEYLQDLATYIEGKLSGLASVPALPSRLRREVLAALLIADDLFIEKKKNADTERKLRELTAAIDSAIDREPVASI